MQPASCFPAPLLPRTSAVRAQPAAPPWALPSIEPRLTTSIRSEAPGVKTPTVHARRVRPFSRRLTATQSLCVYCDVKPLTWRALPRPLKRVFINTALARAATSPRAARRAARAPRARAGRGAGGAPARRSPSHARRLELLRGIRARADLWRRSPRFRCASLAEIRALLENDNSCENL